MKRDRKDRGFVGTLVLIIVALMALKYFFDWSIFDALNSEAGRNTVEYIKEVIFTVWNFIQDWTLLIWDKISQFLPDSSNP